MVTTSDGKHHPSANLLADDLLDAAFAYLDWRDLLRAQVCRRWRAASTRAQAFPSSSILPHILCYLDWRELMRVRGTCTQWREAATRTLVPPSIEKRVRWYGGFYEEECAQFHVHNAATYHTLNAMRKALPNLQQIHLSQFDRVNEEKYLEGDDPDPDGLEWTRDLTVYDVGIVSEFGNLRSLVLDGAPLNGIYPSLFGFKYLRELSISNGSDYPYLRWDLKMLTGMPLIEKLTCGWGGVTGSLSDLLFLKDTLRELTIVSSGRQGDETIGGEFAALADFASLEKLDLERATGIRGDTRQIQATDFPSLQKLILPGLLQTIEQSSEVIGIFTDLAKRPTNPCISSVRLSKDSPDYYEKETYCQPPPFTLEVVKEGRRLGWRWTSRGRSKSGTEHSCEVEWLDPKLETASDERKRTRERDRNGEDVNFYEGMRAPPSAAKYHDMCVASDEARLQRRLEDVRAMDRVIEQSAILGHAPFRR